MKKSIKTDKIVSGKTALGIEFGSTRIKAVLIDDAHDTLAVGIYDWQNKFENNIWTYGLDDITKGLQGCYADLASKVKEQYGVTLTKIGCIGISAMMHGYMVFDKEDNLLAPFRTWRNNCAEFAATELSRLFNYNIPARWSVAHLYQAILNGEEHVDKLAFQTTLEGYIHWQLTGNKVLGVGEASGMFPVDLTTKSYDGLMVNQFDKILAKHNLPYRIEQILPKILLAGEDAGCLTKQGAKFLDPTGNLKGGIPLCPPEGDAGTGMVATDSIKVRTGNISAGTSIFAMMVLEKKLSKPYPEIDLVTTPVGDLVAMVHCNNCTSELNCWVNLFDEFNKLVGNSMDKSSLYEKLFLASLDGDNDCGKVMTINYTSGENITHVENGVPMVMHDVDSKFNLSNFMRSQLYATMATLKVGMDLLLDNEKVEIDKIYAHGGLFKTKGVAQKYLAAALGADVTVMDTASEGGAWGMAVLAMFALRGGGMSLADYLDEKVFNNVSCVTVAPDSDVCEGFNKYTKQFLASLDVERLAHKE